MNRTTIKTSDQPSVDKIKYLVGKRATRLQDDYLGDRKSAIARARRELANLRNNATKEPGVDPSIWELTVEDVSEGSKSDGPTKEERAVHLALTLFAVHQQSRKERMHVANLGLGQAISRLERRAGDHSGDGPSPVRRRFNMVVTSQTLPELTHHLRGLVNQLRAEDIGLDYGQLASDLFLFQLPGRADSVRRQWARQYYYLDRKAPDDDSKPDASDSGIIDIEITEEQP